MCVLISIFPLYSNQRISTFGVRVFTLSSEQTHQNLNFAWLFSQTFSNFTKTPHRYRYITRIYIEISVFILSILSSRQMFNDTMRSKITAWSGVSVVVRFVTVGLLLQYIWTSRLINLAYENSSDHSQKVCVFCSTLVYCRKNTNLL